ncbi:hypothetical protein HD806DRAFT_368176 [Xylariaceae sp. AK1471]|nr:hypothetical protein HD806DRAFT_368176 [Xylariaceae sp. AK1471]
MLLSFQTIGGAQFISTAQSAFVNTLIQPLPVLSLGANSMHVVTTGTGQLRKVFPAEDLPTILESYLKGIKAIYLLETPFAGTAFLVTLIFSQKRLDVVAVKERRSAA